MKLIQVTHPHVQYSIQLIWLAQMKFIGCKVFTIAYSIEPTRTVDVSPRDCGTAVCRAQPLLFQSCWCAASHSFSRQRKSSCSCFNSPSHTKRWSKWAKRTNTQEHRIIRIRKIIKISLRWMRCDCLLLFSTPSLVCRSGRKRCVCVCECAVCTIAIQVKYNYYFLGAIKR